MSELTQSERGTIYNQHDDLETHIMSEVLLSDKKIANIFSGVHISRLHNKQVIVYFTDDTSESEIYSIINAAMNHPEIKTEIDLMSNVHRNDDKSGFIVFGTPNVDQ